jgi:hypothetical protein
MMAVVSRKATVQRKRTVWIIMKCMDGCDGRWPITSEDGYELQKCPTCGTPGIELMRKVKYAEAA